LPPVISPIFLAKTSAPPKIVSSERGKLDAMRQRMLACAWTIAGNLREMFDSIEAVGADAYTMGSKTIGSVLIGRMKIAGD